MARPLSILQGYGLSILCPVLALSVSLLIRGRLDPSLAFVVAIVVPSWVGGIGPGLASVVLSSLVMHIAFFAPPFLSLAAEVRELPYIPFFTLTAGCVCWQRPRRPKGQQW